MVSPVEKLNVVHYFVSLDIWRIGQEVIFMVHVFDVTDPGPHTRCPDGIHTASTGSVGDYGRLDKNVVCILLF